MYANAYELRMPTNYVDMNSREIDYGAGFSIRSLFDIEYTIAVVKGAVAGAVSGALLGSVTGPGALVTAAGGALTGGGVAAVNHISQKATGKSVLDNIVDFFVFW